MLQKNNPQKNEHDFYPTRLAVNSPEIQKNSFCPQKQHDR